MLSKKADGKMAKAGFMPKLKNKKCKMCKVVFMQERFGQVICGTSCVLDMLKAKEARKRETQRKANKKELQESRQDLKWWLKKTQADCNAYIRERDRDDGCISCGTRKPVQYCAGHYRPMGVNSALRFSPLNIHKQCNRNCNMAKSGNLTKYRPRLIKKIGLDMVEWLENNHETKRWTIEECKELRKAFKQMLKEEKDKQRFST
jgi:uncharacterized Zn finger protein (UPF0148 family)